MIPAIKIVKIEEGYKVSKVWGSPSYSRKAVLLLENGAEINYTINHHKCAKVKQHKAGDEISGLFYEEDCNGFTRSIFCTL